MDEFSGELRIDICSDIDYDWLIAEIYCDGKFVALLSQEGGPDHLMVEFLGVSDEESSVRKVGLDWLVNALMAARQRLGG